MTQIVARATGVTRRYGDVIAVNDLTTELAAGEFLGMLGPNGAGKSTLISMFVGLRRPTKGRIELFGRDPRNVVARRRMGMTPQETGFPETALVTEVLDFVASHHAEPVDRGELLDRFALTRVARRQTGGLSGGEKRRLAVALAFVGRPELVFLDEPTAGLDVEARRTLWEAVRQFNQSGGAVVLTSHYLEEVEQLARRVIVIDRGRCVADGTVDALRRVSGLHRVSVTVPEVPTLPGVVGVERVDDRVHLLTPDPDQLVRDLVLSGQPFHRLEVQPGSLEDAFLALTGSSTPVST